MNNNITMRSADALSAKMGHMYVTMNGRRYLFMSLINLEVTFEKKKSSVPIMGRPGNGNKATGFEGKAKATAHYNTSIFRKAAIHYAQTGEDLYFECQITNEDPTSSVGRQTVILKDCNLDSVIMAKLDAEGDYLTEDISWTYDDCSMPEEFAELVGM